MDGSPRHHKSWPAQKTIFLNILSAAQRIGGRVVSIHSRRAAQEVLDYIKEYTTPDRVLPILHWFSDSPSIARQAVNLGCFFSVNQRMFTHTAGMALLRDLPADRLLTETDGPFTLGKKQSGKPFNISAMIAQLASIRGDEFDVMKNVLAENAGRVFAFAGIKRRFNLRL